MADYSFAKAKYVPSLHNTRHVTRVMGVEGEIDAVWKLPTNWNPANCVPIPADTQDLQTYLFGPMSHAITLRPYKPERGCCASSAYTFDLANGMFSEKFGSGSVSNGCCTNEVTVTLPNGTLNGTISRPCISLQQRINLDWSTGENMSLRGPPCITCLGPWRTGFVGTAPGEEEQHLIRFWDLNGMIIDCNLHFCLVPCRLACGQCQICCDCRDRIAFTTWTPYSLDAVRAQLLSSYSLALKSSFGEISFEPGWEYVKLGIYSTEYPSDINALGHYRLPLKKDCCCDFQLSDASDSSNMAEVAGFDLMFRGTMNQNQVTSQDFNLALGYLILNAKFFQDGLKQGQPPIASAMQTLPGAGLLHMADVLPRSDAGGAKMV